ncbi:MAG: EAL domain-containing protein [Alphaproteobacteria bacterium]|nr:EAL domain-containing protein [Alphaproteobacteria bacterium]
MKLPSAKIHTNPSMMVRNPAQKPEPPTVTPERILLETVERIGHLREGWIAVHLHLSDLQARYRDPSYLRIAVRVLDPRITSYRSQILLMGNGDIVVLGRNIPQEDFANAIAKVRSLFGEDPLTQTDPGDGSDPFETWYRLDTEFGIFLDVVKRLNQMEAARRKSSAGQPPKPEDLNASRLRAVLSTLESTDLVSQVRRQAVALVGNASTAEIVYQEFFFAMDEVKKVIAPNIDIMANPWLFQYLAGVLDRTMLGILARSKARFHPRGLSVNLNLSTLKEAAFQAFLDTMPPNQTLIVEVTPVDVFTDVSGYLAQRGALRERGHKMALDRLTPQTLGMLDLITFDADYFKFSWTPDLARARRVDTVKALREMVAARPDSCIMTRCDSEAGVRWGLDMGITLFQGRFVDAMLAAVTMAECDKSHLCTFAQCLSRRAVIDGPLRGECTNHAKVDALPSIRTPRRSSSPPSPEVVANPKEVS